MGADFQQLYGQLGIRAECSLDEFKHACRRRIGDLHPDRCEDAPGEDGQQLHLDELLALYASAIQFHNRHGRLPGAMPATQVAAPHRPHALPLAPEPPLPARLQQVPQHLPHVAAGAAATSSRYPSLILLGGALVLTAVAYFGSNPAPQDEADAGAGLTSKQPVQEHPVQAAQVATDAAPVWLELGMDPTSVIAIQGRPMRIEGDRWEYGPSWLRFDEEGLVDWYSSPLHPLETPHRMP